MVTRMHESPIMAFARVVADRCAIMASGGIKTCVNAEGATASAIAKDSTGAPGLPSFRLLFRWEIAAIVGKVGISVGASGGGEYAQLPVLPVGPPRPDSKATASCVT